MNEVLADLRTVLTSQLDELERLVPVLEDEEQALRRADLPAVLTITERKESTGRRIGALEARRKALVASLAARLDVSPDSLTLSKLETLIPASRGSIGPLQLSFRPVLDRLLAQNARNAFLMEQSLASLQRLLTDLVDALTPGSTYATDGPAGQFASALQLLDRRA
jgi:flagellar biosynthesis/type III secretory pathway chaperone